MSMIRDIAKAIERTIPYFTSTYNLISLVVLIAYGVVRLQNGLPLGRNTVLLCACTIFTRWLRAPNSFSMLTSFPPTTNDIQVQLRVRLQY